MVEIIIVPSEEKIEIETPIKVKYMLRKLGILKNEALVIKDGRILTGDLLLRDNDKVEIRLVTSRG